MACIFQPCAMPTATAATVWSEAIEINRDSPSGSIVALRQIEQ
jgi:predicted permease